MYVEKILSKLEIPIWYPFLNPFLTKSLSSSSMSYKVDTFSNGTGFAFNITFLSLSAPCFNKYSLESLQSSRSAK